MIHTKLLIRRLAYVPWLLAAGLVLGWAGEAAAQITLTLDTQSVREEAGETKIKVTAKATDNLGNANSPVTVLLDWGEGATAPDFGDGAKTEFGSRKGALNADGSVPAADTFDRYVIALPSLTFPKDTKKDATVDGMITFTPHDDDIIGNDNSDNLATPDQDNLRIWVVGNAGSGITITAPARATSSFELIDNDQQSRTITLSYGGAKIAQDADPTDVTVTATLDGAPLTKDLEITLLFDDDAPTDRATRDEDYKADGGVLLTIEKGVATGTADVEIEPLNVGDGKIQMTAKDVNTTSPATVQVYGIVDFVLPDDDDDSSTLTRDNMNETGASGSNISGIVADYDEDGAFTTTDVDGVTVGATFDRRIELLLSSGANAIVIDPTKEAAPKGVKPSVSTVREDAGTVDIDLEVTLKNKLTEDARVSFTIEDPAEGLAAERDVDYQAEFGSLTIEAGQEKGTANLTLTVINNDATSKSKSFVVVASVAGQKARGTITISDDETLTTAITLTAEPAEVTEGDTKSITITGTIDGKMFADETKVILVLAAKDAKPDDIKATAQRDIDFDAVLGTLTIPANSLSGTANISIKALKGGDKKVVVMQLDSPRKNDDGVKVNAKAVAITLKDAPAGEGTEDPGALAFDTDKDLGATPFSYTAEKAIDPLELPDVKGGTKDAKTYSISSLPAGLSFDAATQTISGTPTAATEETTVAYTVIDTDGAAVAMLIKIKIDAAPAPMVVVEKVEVGQNSVREGGAAATIAIKATLAKNGPAGTVEFTLEPSSAVRDVDYKASMSGSIAVEAGATSASTTLTLEPIDNDAEEGNKELTVQAAAGGSSATDSIEITDDETASTGITLSADPHEVSEDADETAVTITATLNGKVLDADAIVTVSIDSGSDAARDEDYSASFPNGPTIKIAKDSIDGSVVLNLTPVADGTDEGNESITLHGAIASLNDGTGTITLTDAELTAEPEVDPLAFAEGAMIDDIEVTVNTALDAVTLPEASGGEGDISYAAEGLPAGVSFDDSTRTISGSPTEEGTSEVTYTATAGDESVSLSFTITVNPPMVIDLSTLFGAAPAAAGKANPASEHGSELETRIQEKVGDDVSITINLPEDATATVDGLPDGLSYDSATRTISGTPTIAGEYIVAVTIGDQLLEFKAVIEALPVLGDLPAIGIAGQPYSQSISLPEGATLSGLPAGLTLVGNTISGTPVAADTTLVTVSAPGAVPDLFQLRLVVRGLGAPPAVMAQDYPNDNSGFVLLSWDLSADHDLIDGYRIFREMELDGGLVSIPWAMVDAVTAPGVDRGYAVVATIDLMATKWGVAAQLGREITDITSTKAVFAGAEDVNQPYELMAETLKASKEAARVGDGPVFATLLPEALAFAQGVVPNLKDVGGVQLSAITLTEEAVGPIDNIAPLSVPAVRAVDVLNDEGGRIEVTWTLSPSDRILQDVIAEATGPAAVQPVSGVHGYSIHRRAVGDEDFVMVGQVEAGVTSFVDETAAHGTRYIYEVRPFDSDNELSSDVEEAAIAVRNNVLDSEETPILGLFGGDSSVGLDDFFLFADHFLLTTEDVAFDAAFDLDGNGEIGFDDFFIFADPANFGRSTPAAGKRVPMFAGLNADARMYLDARTAMPSVGEDFVLDVSLADFAAVKGYGLQVQYDANRLDFVQALTEQPLGGSELATPQVLADEAGVLTVAAHGDVVSEGEVALSLVFRPTTEIEETVIEITNSQTYDDEFGFNSLALPAPVQVQTRPEVFALANNYPNPFNPATTIKYALPQAADVELTVYNVVGQVVRTLVAEHQSAGRYVVEWDATNDSGHNLSSGMYFYRLEAGGEFREVKKMLLLK